MKNLTHINSLEVVAAKDFLKQNMQNPELIQEITIHKESWVPKLLSLKFFPDVFAKEIMTSKEGMPFLGKEFLAAGFTPSMNFISDVIDLGKEQETLLIDLLKAFPTLPMTVQLLMKMLNTGLSEAAMFLMVSKKEFQKTEICSILLKEGVYSKEFSDLCLANEGIVSYMVELLNSGNTSLNARLVSDLVESHFPKELKGKELIDLPFLSIEAYSLILRRGVKEQYGYYKHNKAEINYNPLFEEMDPYDLSSVILKKVPVGSRYRLEYLKYEPQEASREELDLLLDKNYLNGRVLKIMMGLGLDYVKKIKIEAFEKSFSPTELTSELDSLDMKLYFLENISSKYGPALRKVIPLDKIPVESNTRKNLIIMKYLMQLRIIM